MGSNVPVAASDDRGGRFPEARPGGAWAAGRGSEGGTAGAVALVSNSAFCASCWRRRSNEVVGPRGKHDCRPAPRSVMVMSLGR